MEDKPEVVEKRIRGGLGMGKEKQLLLEDLGLLMGAGIGIQAALESVKNELKSNRLKKLIAQIQSDIENGQDFSDALEASGLLPAYVVTLIRIGEDSGRLAENLDVVIRQQEKDVLFRSKLRSAMMYPLIVLGLAGVVGLGIAWFILPRLATLFRDLKVQLPLPTRVLIGLANFLHDHALLVLGGCAVIFVIIALLYASSQKVRDVPLVVASKIPVLGKLIQQIELARFGYITGSLLEAGLPIVDVFMSLSSASRLNTYKHFYKNMAESIGDGDSFKTIFHNYKRVNKLIPGPVQALIIAGEQSGKLAPTLTRLGGIYEEKIDTSSKNLATLLEPIMLVFVWLMVVAIALAVILPIYKLIGGLN